jgi:hypothetical protein
MRRNIGKAKSTDDHGGTQNFSRVSPRIPKIKGKNLA